MTQGSFAELCASVDTTSNTDENPQMSYSLERWLNQDPCEEPWSPIALIYERSIHAFVRLRDLLSLVSSGWDSIGDHEQTSALRLPNDDASDLISVGELPCGLDLPHPHSIYHLDSELCDVLHGLQISNANNELPVLNAKLESIYPSFAKTPTFQTATIRSSETPCPELGGPTLSLPQPVQSSVERHDVAPLPKRLTRKQKQKSGDHSYACPMCKANRVYYENIHNPCTARIGLGSDMKRVREHLEKYHSRNLRCLRCYRKFKANADTQYRHHVQSNSCTSVEPQAQPELFTDVQEVAFAKLKNAVPQDLSMEDKWREYYKALHPNAMDKDIINPYYDYLVPRHVVELWFNPFEDHGTEHVTSTRLLSPTVENGGIFDPSLLPSIANAQLPARSQNLPTVDPYDGIASSMPSLTLAPTTTSSTQAQAFGIQAQAFGVQAQAFEDKAPYAWFAARPYDVIFCSPSPLCDDMLLLASTIDQPSIAIALADINSTFSMPVVDYKPAQQNTNPICSPPNTDIAQCLGPSTPQVEHGICKRRRTASGDYEQRELKRQRVLDSDTNLAYPCADFGSSAEHLIRQSSPSSSNTNLAVLSDRQQLTQFFDDAMVAYESSSIQSLSDPDRLYPLF